MTQSLLSHCGNKWWKHHLKTDVSVHQTANMPAWCYCLQTGELDNQTHDALLNIFLNLKQGLQQMCVKIKCAIYWCVQ